MQSQVSEAVLEAKNRRLEAFELHCLATWSTEEPSRRAVCMLKRAFRHRIHRIDISRTQLTPPFEGRYM